MRSFEECKAEIFLRRDKLVKMKKRNKKLTLSICAVLFVCTALFSVSLLPQFFAPKSNMMDGGNAEYITLGGVMDNVVSIEFENGVKYESSVDINRIVQAMSGDILSEGAVADSATGTTDDNGQIDQSVNKQEKGIRFTLTDNLGNKTVYMLLDNVLVNETHNRKTFLSEYQSNEIIRTALRSD